MSLCLHTSEWERCNPFSEQEMYSGFELIKTETFPIQIVKGYKKASSCKEIRAHLTPREMYSGGEKPAGVKALKTLKDEVELMIDSGKLPFNDDGNAKLKVPRAR